MKIYLLLLACGADEAIREPDLPVIDIGAYDIDHVNFVFQIESNRSVDRPIFPRIVITYRGHYENDRFRRLKFRTETYGHIITNGTKYVFKIINGILHTDTMRCDYARLTKVAPT